MAGGSGIQRLEFLQREEEEEQERTRDKALVFMFCLLLPNMCFSLVMLLLCLSQTELARVWTQQQTGELCVFSFHPLCSVPPV